MCNCAQGNVKGLNFDTSILVCLTWHYLSQYWHRSMLQFYMKLWVKINQPIFVFFLTLGNMVINTVRSRYMLHCSRNNFMVRLCVYREFEILPKFYFWNCCAVNNIGVCCTVIYWKSIVFLPFLFLSAGLCTQPFLHTVNLTGHGRCGSNVENDFFQTRFTDSYLSQFRWKPLNHID